MSALLSRQQAQLAASCLSLLVYTGCADNATAPEPAPAPLTELPAASKQAWEAFRAAFPFHTQGLALSEEHTDGTRTLIVAEPPPSVTVAKVQAVDSTAILAAEVMNHRLGFDGYVRDLVLTVADDEAKLAGMESGINRLVHGSSYKAQVLLAPYHPARLAVKLDLSVTALEVEQWLHAPDLTLLSVFGEPIEGVEALRALPGSRVAYSATPGLVLWWIPSGTLLDEQLEVIRQFTIDSDLILGAEIADDGVLVVGRERLAPLSLLPPLRAETIALLAGVDLAELAQSYERNHPLAGPLNADLDWAPIYLNPELLDTEYGSLLNLTDQILKGWSNNGLTHYENFSYPEPKEWPFEDPIPIHLKADTLTYNWNTTGTGYTVSGQSGVVYALNRTGALPVSYIPGGDEAALQNPDSSEIARLRAAEERAYEYFAHLNDPLLVRVVQYASLFQIFTLAPSIGARVTQAPEPPEPVLESFTLDVLRKIRDVEGSERERLIEAIKSRGERFGLDPTYATFAFSLLEGTLVGASDEDLTKLVQAVRLKHIFKAEAETDEDAASLLELLEAARVVLPLAAAQQQIYTKYSAAVAGQRRSGWIRTPSLVLSGGSGSLAMSIGGHNLSARVSKFKTDPSIARNSLRIGEIDGNPVVFVNPADAAKISEMVRTAGKNQADPAQLMAQLHMELQTVKEPRPRPMGVALGHPPPGGGRRPP
ncbi:MAG: hypothetical protein K8J08_01800, partial [Thermoanaerobaculia bacterium]|nr:hypothetical protein [Thermoanaerobaculia bacterium]